MGLGFLGGYIIRYMKDVIESRRMVNEIEVWYTYHVGIQTTDHRVGE
jgi:hypothetical protein